MFLVSTRTLLAFFLIASLAASVGAVPLHTVWRDGTLGAGGGAAGIHLGDFDGDGTNDLVSCSVGAPYVLTQEGAGFRTLWYGPQVGCGRVAAGDLDGDGRIEIVVATTSGGPYNEVPGAILRFDYGSADATATMTLPTTFPVTGLVVANVRGDSAPEIVAATSAAAYVIGGTALDIQWEAPGKGGTHVHCGDLDGNQTLEVVVNGNPAHILDAAAKVELFAYGGGFGQCSAVGDIDGDGKAEIVTCVASSQVKVIEGDTLATKWTYSGGNYDAYDSGGVADLTNDGIGEVLLGGNQATDVIALRGSDGAEVFRIDSPNYGVPTITGGNADSDASAELIWGAGVAYSGSDMIYIADVANHVIQYSTPDLGGDWLSSAADVDGDGEQEIVVAAPLGYSFVRLMLYDAAGYLKATKQVEMNLTRMNVGQFDGDPQLEIALFGGSYWSKFITVDGSTLNVEHTSPDLPAPLSAVAVGNVDGDSIDEIAILMSSLKEVHIYNGASNYIQAILGPFASEPKDVQLEDLDLNGICELLLVRTDRVSVHSAPAWSETAGAPITGGRLVAAAPMSPSGAARLLVATRQNAYPYTDSLLRLNGTTLETDATCTLSNGVSAMTWVDWGRTSRFVFASPSGLFTADPAAADFCASVVLSLAGSTNVSSLMGHDVDGDGVREIIAGSNSSVGLHEATLPLYGDADGDGTVSGADIFMLIHHVFSGGPAPGPLGDVNGDGLINSTDIDNLVDYLYGTAPRPL